MKAMERIHRFIGLTDSLGYTSAFQQLVLACFADTRSIMGHEITPKDPILQE
jgi:hypothetical protein